MRRVRVIKTPAPTTAANSSSCYASPPSFPAFPAFPSLLFLLFSVVSRLVQLSHLAASGNSNVTLMSLIDGIDNCERPRKMLESISSLYCLSPFAQAAVSESFNSAYHSYSQHVKSCVFRCQSELHLSDSGNSIWAI
ncbi:hypothetical protein ACLKA6_013693 [Drosophila palustris]